MVLKLLNVVDPLSVKWSKKTANLKKNIKNSIPITTSKIFRLHAINPTFFRHSKIKSTTKETVQKAKIDSIFNARYQQKCMHSSIWTYRDYVDEEDKRNEDINGFCETKVYLVWDLTPDPRKIGPKRWRIVRDLLHENKIAFISSKWAPMYSSYLNKCRKLHIITKAECVSLIWLVCQYVRMESMKRSQAILYQKKNFIRNYMNYQLAIQFLTGVPVIKYGRKGKPHKTKLIVDNMDRLRWERKVPNQKRKGIFFVDIQEILLGHQTKVFYKAIEKNYADKEELCFSIITKERTLDLCAQNKEQRDWFYNSMNNLVKQAKEKQRQESKRIEMNIIQRIQQIHLCKHGRKGKPHMTQISISKCGEIRWKGKSGGNILLTRVEEIIRGKQTEVFKRTSFEETEERHCLSLITSERTLDLEVDSESLRDWLLIAFRYLVDSCHERLHEIARQRQELREQKR